MVFGVDVLDYTTGHYLKHSFDCHKTEDSSKDNNSIWLEC